MAAKTKRTGRRGAEPGSLQSVPGIGPNLAHDLERLGYADVAALRGQDPEAMYRRLMELEGRHVDRCVLYVFRCAVYFANTPEPDPEFLKWWSWKDGGPAMVKN